MNFNPKSPIRNDAGVSPKIPKESTTQSHGEVDLFSDKLLQGLNEGKLKHSAVITKNDFKNFSLRLEKHLPALLGDSAFRRDFSNFILSKDNHGKSQLEIFNQHYALLANPKDATEIEFTEECSFFTTMANNLLLQDKNKTTVPSFIELSTGFIVANRIGSIGLQDVVFSRGIISGLNADSNKNKTVFKMAKLFKCIV